MTLQPNGVYQVKKQCRVINTGTNPMELEYYLGILLVPGTKVVLVQYAPKTARIDPEWELVTIHGTHYARESELLANLEES